MEMSITSEIISQQTICGNNESLNLNTNMDNSKEQTKFEKNAKQSEEGERDLLQVLFVTENGMYKGNSLQMHNDGYATHTILPGEGSCKEKWEGEDTPNRCKEVG